MLNNQKNFRQNLNKILQVSNFDTFGGAARIALSLHTTLRSRDYKAWMAVGTKFSNDPDIYLIPRYPDRYFDQKIFAKLYDLTKNIETTIFNQHIYALFNRLRNWRYDLNYLLGRENFDFPGTWQILDLPPKRPDLIHIHNMHIGYFDLRYLPNLSHNLPTLLTLHDTWLLSGLCAHSLGCERWKTGCGKCPHLDKYPVAVRDATRFNWKRKREIHHKSRLYVAAPSQWVINQLPDSILAQNVVKTRVIKNGIDLDIFYPLSKMEARQRLGLPTDGKILLFVSVGAYNNPFKDYKTIDIAVRIVAEKNKGHKLTFVSLGEGAPSTQIGNVEFRSIPHISDPKIISNYYQAADVYLHAAHADTFPTVILEALACGAPVIATSVGGIPEQIADGSTGFLIPHSDAQAMADKIEQLITDDNLCKGMGLEAANNARRHFGVDHMVDDYLDFYKEVLDDWQENKLKLSINDNILNN